jgi:hypothetical protein
MSPKQNVYVTKHLRGKKYLQNAIQRGENLHGSPQKRKSVSFTVYTEVIVSKNIQYGAHYLILNAKGLT